MWYGELSAELCDDLEGSEVGVGGKLKREGTYVCISLIPSVSQLLFEVTLVYNSY